MQNYQMLAIRTKKQMQKDRGMPKTTIKSKYLEVNKSAKVNITDLATVLDTSSTTIQ